MKTDRLFANGKPVIGMIHTNHTDKESTLQLAQREIEIYLRHGVYPLIENYFGDDDDCEDVLRWMQQKHPGEIYGLNILGNFYRSFELAEKYGASFIQIDSVCGHLKPALDEEYESALKLLRSNSDCTVLGGVRFKYQPVKSGRTLAEDLKIGMGRCDAIVCTGEGTGLATPMEKVEKFKQILGDFPVIIGAGVAIDMIEACRKNSDGLIVGSWFKDNHRAEYSVNEEYVKDFMLRWNAHPSTTPLTNSL